MKTEVTTDHLTASAWHSLTPKKTAPYQGGDAGARLIGGDRDGVDLKHRPSSACAPPADQVGLQADREAGFTTRLSSSRESSLLSRGPSFGNLERNAS